jgi:hypothetical protein
LLDFPSCKPHRTNALLVSSALQITSSVIFEGKFIQQPVPITPIAGYFILQHVLPKHFQNFQNSQDAHLPSAH